MVKMVKMVKKIRIDVWSDQASKARGDALLEYIREATQDKYDIRIRKVNKGDYSGVDVFDVWGAGAQHREIANEVSQAMYDAEAEGLI